MSLARKARGAQIVLQKHRSMLLQRGTLLAAVVMTASFLTILLHPAFVYTAGNHYGGTYEEMVGRAWWASAILSSLIAGPITVLLLAIGRGVGTLVSRAGRARLASKRESRQAEAKARRESLSAVKQAEVARLEQDFIALTESLASKMGINVLEASVMAHEMLASLQAKGNR